MECGVFHIINNPHQLKDSNDRHHVCSVFFFSKHDIAFTNMSSKSDPRKQKEVNKHINQKQSENH